jgi:predicted nucleic acid-binding protein
MQPYPSMVQQQNVGLDTNVLVRYITGDDNRQATLWLHALLKA